MTETPHATPDGDATRAAVNTAASGNATRAAVNTAAESEGTEAVDHAPTSGAHAAGAGAADAGASGDQATHDDHGNGAPLGPLDAQAWGAGILGVATGGLVALLLYLVSYH